MSWSLSTGFRACGILALTLTMVLALTGISLAQDAETSAGEPAAPAATEPSAEGDASDEAAPTETEEEAAAAPAPASMADVDALWTVLAAILVFFMQAGFAMVESGFTRAKNACNIIMKNLMDVSIGSVAFWMVGFGLMFGASSATAGWIGLDNFFFDATKEAPKSGVTESFGWAFLIFQTVFCATAATIVSGAVAERTRYVGYLCYSVAITALVYPIFGSWAWGSLWQGEGWLEGMGFADFAGSTVVHSVGGWCALAGAIVVGPRIGKFSKDGKVNPIPGHSLPLAAMGVFILWLGWFGFNAGSTTSVRPDGASFAYIAVTTNLAAAAGAIGAMIGSWVMFKKPDPSFALNGALAGLVSITAGCDALTPAFAALAGLIGGVLVILSVVFFDKLRIDDPVGAISVHGVCGAWGTLCVALFGGASLVVQLIGIGVAFAWAFSTSLVIFLAIKVTIGLRAGEEEELEGLDITEHGIFAYPPGFVADSLAGSPAAAAAAGGAPRPAAVPATGSA